MERENKKRGRDETEFKAAMDAEKQLSGRKESEQASKAKKKAFEIPGVDYEDVAIDASETPHTYRPLGVFEFPWRDEGLVLQSDDDGWELRDVFFSSLVDGCPAAIVIQDESDGEVDGGDCIWSCVLSQPLAPALCLKASTSS